LAGPDASTDASTDVDPDVGAVLATIFGRHPVVDLTLPLDETLPGTWPGHMPYRATVSAWFDDRPDDPQPVHSHGGGFYQTRWLVIDEHTGTHVDAPKHFIPPPDLGLPHAGPGGAIGVADLPLLASSGSAAVVDVRELAGQAEPGQSPAITPGHVTAFERQHGPLQAGDVVLFRTGWDARYQPGPDGGGYGADVLVTSRVPGWAAPQPETIELIRDRGVTCVGTDGLSMGPAEGGAPTHLAGLPYGLTYVEALGALDRVPPRGAWFLFLPLRLVGGTGSPGRALAVLPAACPPLRRSGLRDRRVGQGGGQVGRTGPGEVGQGGQASG
jgi:isatin hydrolase